MKSLNREYMTNNENNLNPENNPNINTFNNKKNITEKENIIYSANDEIINYDTNIFNNNQNPINVEEINQKNSKINTINYNIYDKIYLYINDIKEIDNVVPFCQEKKRKELLLDRGLLLCLKVNELMNDNDIKIDDIYLYKKNDNIEIDNKLLDENYWMNQKVDKYARTEQRQRIPQERWFMIKDNSFTPNLNKCFALNRGKFIDTYNWLNSLEYKY